MKALIFTAGARLIEADAPDEGNDRYYWVRARIADQRRGLDGSFDIVRLRTEKAHGFVHDEGRVMEPPLPPNWLATILCHATGALGRHDYIAGVMVLFGTAGADECDVPPDLVEKLRAVFPDGFTTDGATTPSWATEWVK